LSTPSLHDALPICLDELSEQQEALAHRETIYRNLRELESIERVTAVKSAPVTSRLQHAFTAPSGDELRAAMLEQIAELPLTSSGIANKPFTTKIGIISD